jgi:hypothetical protein
MDKIQLAGQNLGRVFNSRSGREDDMQLHCFGTKLSNLKLKTLPKQILGYLKLDIARSGLSTENPFLSSLIFAKKASTGERVNYQERTKKLFGLSFQL